MRTKAEIVRDWLPRYTGRDLDSFGKYVLLTNFSQYVTSFAQRFGVPVFGDEFPIQSASAENLTILNFGMGSAMAATVMDLLAAVERFVGGTVTGATSGQVRFHARVAANALAIVRRQLTMGDTAALVHRERLAELGYADDDSLAAAIAAGELDDRLAVVGQALAGAVVDKLAVANPGYLEAD